MDIEVSVIIVNYNTLRMTESCIESVLKFSSNKIEIILVDNASVDGSFEVFSNDARIKYIYNEQNIGFGRANNVGVESAVGKYIFLLNSDTLFLDDVISKIFKFAELKGRFGAIGTRLLDEQLQDTMSFSQFLTPKRIYNKVLRSLNVQGASEDEKIYINLERDGVSTVDFVIGADLFMLREVFLMENGFDPAFFMYYEETDLQLRLSKNNYTIYLLDIKDIIHLEGGSFGSSIPFRRKMMMTKGMKIYIKKHFNGFARVHILLLVFLTLLKDLRKLNYTRKESLLLMKEILN